MHKLLSIFFLLAVTVSGCVQAPEHREVKYADIDNPQNNYIIFTPSVIEPNTGTFTMVTPTFTAGGSYTETSAGYTLKYGEAPVGVTLKKVKNGINLVGNIYWYM